MRFATWMVGLAAVVGLGASGCDALRYTKPHDGQANGAARTLYFVDVDDADVGTVPLGGARTVKVARYSPGTVDCAKFPATPEGANVALRGGPTVPPDRCNALAAEEVELVSASCPDDTCAVTSTVDAGIVTLRIEGKAARATKLDVTLAKRGSSETWRDSVAIAFAKAGRIALRGASELHAPRVVGAEMYLPNAHLLDESGREMSIDADAMTRSQKGDAFSPPESDVGRVHARAAGKTTYVWEVAGVLRREESVEVVAPSEVRELQAFTLVDAEEDVGDVETKARWLSSEPLRQVIASSREQTTVIVAARLKDDRIAIVSPTEAELLPRALGSAEAYATGAFVVFPASPPVAGEGTVRVRAGTLEATFPIELR